MAFDPETDVFLPDFEAGLLPAPPETTETYLRLAALNPDDVPGILDFLNSYGELGVRGQYKPDAHLWSQLNLVRDEEAKELVAAYERAIEVHGRWGERAETLVEVRWAILLMRDLIAAWRILRGEIDHAAHEWECPLWRHRTEPLDSPPWTPEGPALLLGGVMADGLTPFSPAVLTYREGQGPYGPYISEVATWNLCCLELFNHIAAGEVYKACANETCNRLFVRQSGRAEHGQHRTKGVKYCTSECARAQAQREYRRRKGASP